MQITKNIPYYLIAAGLFILLKFGFTLAGNDDLRFLLTPADKFTEVLTGAHSVYSPDDGYYFEKLNILIDKSCSGFNFWILCFLTLTVPVMKYSDKPLHKILAIPVTLAGAYFLTIFVNTSRVFVSIMIQDRTKDILSGQQYLLHEAVGVITNLSFLILAYCLIEKCLTYRKLNAKFTES